VKQCNTIFQLQQLLGEADLSFSDSSCETAPPPAGNTMIQLKPFKNI